MVNGSRSADVIERLLCSEAHHPHRCRGGRDRRRFPCGLPGHASAKAVCIGASHGAIVGGIRVAGKRAAFGTPHAEKSRRFSERLSRNSAPATLLLMTPSWRCLGSRGIVTDALHDVDSVLSAIAAVLRPGDRLPLY